MSPTRSAAALALLVAVAGCTGLSGDAGTTPPATEPGAGATTAPTTDPVTTDPTTASTADSATNAGGDATEPHTASGTSHTSSHLGVRAAAGVENVTVTLAPNGSTATHSLESTGYVDLTHAIHARGHGVRVVVERGDETVFDQTVHGYEDWTVTAYENRTDVEYVVV